MAGESFARYVVKARLRALGLHVNAYRAAEPGLEREVELRVLHLTGGAGPEEAERFGREFRALASFDHPNLIQVLDIGKTAEHIFYATYYRESQSIEEMLQKGRLPELTVARAACAAAAGLQYLHGRGYLHRSLSASSLFRDALLDRFYIGDFSTMATAAAGNGPEAPGSARLSMTPEARYHQPFDHRTDLFLLGSTLYRMLTGMDPLPNFDQLGTSKASFLQPPMGLAPEICREMDGFLVKALEPEPANRFQDAAEMLAAAEHIVKKLELKSLVERTSSSAAIPLPRDASGLISGVSVIPHLAGSPPSSPEASNGRLSRAQLRSAPTPPSLDAGDAQAPAASAGLASSPSAMRPAAIRPSREASRSGTTPLPAEEPAPDGLNSGLSKPRQARHRGPSRREWASRKVRAFTRDAVGYTSRALQVIPQRYRWPAGLATAGGFVVLVLVALSLRPSIEPPPPATPPAEIATPAAPPVNTTPIPTAEETAEKLKQAARRAADQVRQIPTDLTTFRERWQALRRWYVSLPASKQSQLFTYDALVKVKIDFASDPGEACSALDSLYEKSGPEMK